MSFFFGGAPPTDDAEPVSSRITRIIASTRPAIPRPATPPQPSIYKREIADLTSQLEAALRVVDELKGARSVGIRVGSAMKVRPASGRPGTPDGGKCALCARRTDARDVSSGPSRPPTAHMVQDVTTSMTLIERARSPSPSARRRQPPPPPPPAEQPSSPPDTIVTLPLTKDRIMSAASVVAASKPFDPPTTLAVALGEREGGWRDRCRSSPPVPSSYLPRLLPNIPHMLQGDPLHHQASASSTHAHHYHPQSHQHPHHKPQPQSQRQQSATAQTHLLNSQIQALTSALRICIDVIAEEGRACAKWRRKAAALERGRRGTRHHHHLQQHTAQLTRAQKNAVVKRPATVGGFPTTSTSTDAHPIDTDATVALVQKLCESLRPYHKDPTHSDEDNDQLPQHLVLPATRLRKQVASNRPRYESAYNDAPASTTSAPKAPQPLITANAESIPEQKLPQPSTTGIRAATAPAPAVSKISIRIPTAAAHRAKSTGGPSSLLTTATNRVLTLASDQRRRKRTMGAVKLLTPFCEVGGS
ncbi:hypothetical protein DFJ77DRAFT_114627 [Powellomyces hirtus]|nr:hypothetical protein DFJ77DRAFT_114627 [Powellomyces hirtus]